MSIFPGTRSGCYGGLSREVIDSRSDYTLLASALSVHAVLPSAQIRRHGGAAAILRVGVSRSHLSRARDE